MNVFHSMFMSKPASTVSLPVKDEWAETNAALAAFKAFADNPFAGKQLAVADCYGG